MSEAGWIFNKLCPTGIYFPPVIFINKEHCGIMDLFIAHTTSCILYPIHRTLVILYYIFIAFKCRIAMNKNIVLHSTWCHTQRISKVIIPAYITGAVRCDHLDSETLLQEPKHAPAGTRIRITELW